MIGLELVVVAEVREPPSVAISVAALAGGAPATSHRSSGSDGYGWRYGRLKNRTRSSPNAATCSAVSSVQPSPTTITSNRS